MAPAAGRVLAVGSLYPPHALGGYEVIWRSAMAALRDAGWAVRVVASDFRLPDRADATEDPDVHRDLRWYWRDDAFPQTGRRERLALEVGNRRTLRRHLREHRPDVVMWWPMGGMSLSLIETVRRAGVPAVGYVADDWMLYGVDVDQWLQTWRHHPRLARPAAAVTRVPTAVALDDAAEWHFISRETLRRAREGGRTPRRAEITHAGVDPARFPPAPAQPWAWRLLYLGRLDARKGVDVAIRALAELPAEATLRVQGRGDERYAERLRALVDELGLGERVTFGHGDHASTAAAYAAADAVLFPVAWPEPWGLVPLEAMSVGRPVLATGTGGSREYLEPGGNCLLFDAGDHAALAEQVRRLADDAALRERLVAGGRATATRLTEAACNARLLAAVAQARRGDR